MANPVVNPVIDRRKKEGFSWLHKATGQLRASVDKDLPISYFQPLVVYIAGETIKKGQPISVNLPNEASFVQANLTANNKTYDTNKIYVVASNTKKHVKAVGLAQEPANPGEEVHIVNLGRIVLKANDPNTYCPPFTENDEGKLVYVKEGVIDHYGELTTTEDNSYVSYGDTIVVGHVVRVLMNGSILQEVELNLNFEGDQRGPIDSTQFEAYLAEEIIVPFDDPIRVIALSQEVDQNFMASFIYKAQNGKVYNTDCFMIFLRGSRAAIISMQNISLPSITPIRDTFTYKDAEKIRVLAGLGTSNVKIVNLAFSSGNQGIAVVELRNKLLGTTGAAPTTPSATGKLQEALDFVFNKPGESYQIYDINTIQAAGTGVQESFIFKVKTTDGIGLQKVEFYTSSNLYDNFGDTLIQQEGQVDSKGKAVLADIRYTTRSTPFGIYIGNHWDELLTVGSPILTLSKGLYRIPTKNPGQLNQVQSSFRLETGKEYYLGENGTITCYPERDIPYATTLVRIGVAQSPEILLVGIAQIKQDFKLGEFPIGYTKPAVNGQPEYGYLLADGTTELKVEDYPELYNYLKQFFTDSDLKVVDRP
jgi:hypothetical protein